MSDLCDEYHIQPTLFYLWQRQAFEQLSAALQDGRTRRSQAQAVSADRIRITALEAQLVKKDTIIADVSREAILRYHETHAPEGYRRMTFMMLDADVVAVSPATVYRMFKAAGVLDHWNGKPSKKGTGFVQPLCPHEHWHIDISYVNIVGTFYYLCSILDGASRFIVHWKLRERMTKADVKTLLQRAHERFPDARPRIISDNSPQFIAKDFKEFIRLAGMTHVRTSPYYPQSNGKMERWYQTLKVATIRPTPPESLDDARRMVASFVAYYNHERLHSAIGFITPADLLAARADTIWTVRHQKLETARARRCAASQDTTTLSLKRYSALAVVH